MREPWWCDRCGMLPAKMLLPDSGRRLCGVCAHQLMVAKDLARRIATARRQAA